MPPSQAIATVSSVSYLGLLLGPPLFGGLATLLKGIFYYSKKFVDNNLLKK
jgi:hypothetical protein